jgi:hypothetical protein
MPERTRNRRFGRFAAFAIGALGLVAVALPVHQANAQMYLGWDFGNGFGVGIGTPPSAMGYHFCGFVATRNPYCRNW